jgi:hypothetical protein
MRKKLAPSLLLLSTLFLSSCSFSNKFVVVNKSNAPITVQYTFSYKGASPEEPYQVPAKQTLQDFENNDGQWRTLSRDEYVFDGEAGRVGVTVAPGEALLIDRTMYAGHSVEDETEFLTITSIRLKGANGTVRYGGAQAHRQFKLAFKTTYTITYY